MTPIDYIHHHLPQIRRTICYQAYKFHLNQQDFTQDVLARIITNAAGYRDDTNGLKGFLNWVSFIARNMALSQLRGPHPLFTDLHSWTATTSDSSSRLDTRTRVAAIYRSLRTAGRGRLALMLYLRTQGYKCREIGALLSIQSGTVRSVLLRLREELLGNQPDAPNYPISVEFKSCAKCHHELHAAAFPINTHDKTGLHRWCRNCLKIYQDNRRYGAKEIVAGH